MSRISFQTRLLAALTRGPVTPRQAYRLAATKRSAQSRLAEMRVAGLIEDVIVLTERGKEAAGLIKKRISRANVPG